MPDGKPTIADVLRSGTPLETVASTYPLDEATIAEHASVLDWEALCRNPNIQWTEAMLERFAARLDWYQLARNPALPWSVTFVEKLVASGHVTWGGLRWQSAIVRDPALCELMLPKWLELPRTQWCAGSTDDRSAGPLVPASWDSWGGPEAAAWAHPLVERMPDTLWTFLGAVDGFPWTIEFIAKHADRLDWRRLSWNSRLPWTIDFVRRFGDRISWDDAVFRIPWTAELAREVADRIDWRRLQDDDFPWTPALIEELADRIYWARPDMDIGGWEGTFRGLVQDERFEWTLERFERLRGTLEAHFERVFREDPDFNDDSYEPDPDDAPDDDASEPGSGGRYWTAWCSTGNWSREMFDRAIELERELGMETIDWEQVSGHARTPWTDEFVARHADKLVVWQLQSNEHFPFARHLHRFADRFSDWEWTSISSSALFEPTIELLETYGDRLDWKKLSENAKLSPDIVARFADRWAWDRLVRNEDALTADVVATMRERIPSSAWPAIAKRFPALADVRPGLLAGRDEQDVLDDAAVRDLLTSAHMASSSELEAAIDRAPDDRDAYRAYADWLRERRDPQGDLIALMLEREAEDEAARYLDRLELGQVIVRWRFGFIDELYELYGDWKRVLGMRVLRFLRGFSMTMTATGDLTAADLSVIAQRTWLERLSLAHAKLERYDALGPLARLRDLRLDHAPVRDLGFLAELGRLEILGLWNTGITDAQFAALRGATRLRALHAGHNPITDLAPLAELRALEELDIRYSNVGDLSPLEHLASLRRLAPEASAVSAAELARFSRIRPDVEITYYKDWPGASIVLPMRDSRPLDAAVGHPGSVSDAASCSSSD